MLCSSALILFCNRINKHRDFIITLTKSNINKVKQLCMHI